MADASSCSSIEGLELDHVGVEVTDLPAAIELFVALFGYHQATEPVVNSRHQVEVVFVEKAGSLPIKLFRSLVERAPPSSRLDLPSFIPSGFSTVPSSRPPAALSHPVKLHHLAFRARELDAALEALVERGARVLSPPAPGEAFDDEPIAFVFASGLNIELTCTGKRRGRLADK